MALLELDELRVAFHTEDGLVQAVDGLSCALEPGRVLGLVGESGAGKSVAALTVMGLTRGRGVEISGAVRFEGRDLLAASARELRALRGDGIAMIFQDPLASMHPLRRVGRQLEEAVRVHRPVARAAARARALEMLELVGLPEPARRLDSYPHELSGGMRQRAMIAMALVNEPRLLIADEPTTALDVTVQAGILELLGSLRRELGMAVLLITHDLGVVAEVADEVAVMYAGRLVESAPAARIFAAPEHPYTWGLLGSIPRLDGAPGERLAAIPGRPPSLIDRPGGCSFHPRCPYVQPAHRTVVPALEPVDGDPGHAVACLLESSARRALWRERKGAGDARAERGAGDARAERGA